MLRMMLKLHPLYFSWESGICDMVMAENHVTVSCIFLDNLSEKTMSFLQSDARNERLQASVKLTVIVRPILWIIGFIYTT